MKLVNLDLRNFKGVKSFTLDAKGEDVTVCGDNATGKTSIFDAFTWLLHGKDSQNKATFDIKTLDEDNQPLHGLDHEVEAMLNVGQKLITLKKTYKEKWTKRRGSAAAEFTGHTTDHFVDGVPVSKKDYDLQIEQIASEDTFRLLTSPAYFNEHLHWQDRRKILLDVCGDISDADVIASDKTLAKLPAILGERTMDDLRKIIAARRAKINKELDKIPVRIDEVQHSLPDVTGLIPEELKQKTRTIKARIKEKEEQVARIEGGGEVAAKTKALREIEGQLLDLRNKHIARHTDELTAKQAELSTANDKSADLQGEVKRSKASIETDKGTILDLKQQMDALRDRWSQVNSREFAINQDEVCPTCGQTLPAEKLARAREQALSDFNREKASKLESISAKGKELRKKADDLAAECAAAGERLDTMKDDLQKTDDLAVALVAQMNAIKEKVERYQREPTFKEKLQQKEDMEKAIAQLQEGNKGEVVTIRAEIGTLEQEIRTAQGHLADIDRVQQGDARIKELQDQERKLAEEYEKLEEQLFMTEQFVRTKVALLEERINSKFKMARFKLFDTQINGGIVEVCETMYNGVPYSSLNNAARINIGLDIINALSEHYSFSAPIFVDNAEAVVELIKTRGQLIRLVVSEQDKELRVEVEGGVETLFKEVV